MVAEALAQERLLGAPTGQHQVQPGILRVGAQKGVGEQVDPLLPCEAPAVEDVEAPAEHLRVSQAGVEAIQVDAALPPRHPG